MNPLLSRWKLERGYDPFFADGVIDATAWRDAPLRVAFLLKESYGDWFGIDGPVNIRSGKNSKFWWNICRWKFLINRIANGERDQAFPAAEDLPEVRFKGDRLDDIAYINIKKSIGTSQSHNKEIQSFAVRDQEFLREQIDGASPQVVLCGGTFWSYHVLYDKLESVSKLADKVYIHNNRLVIDFFHPGYFAAKGGERGLYDQLFQILNSPKVATALDRIARGEQGVAPNP